MALPDAVCVLACLVRHASHALFVASDPRACGPVVQLQQVNVSELGLVTQTGKVVWGKYAQVTNKPELDGCINAVLLV